MLPADWQGATGKILAVTLYLEGQIPSQWKKLDILLYKMGCRRPPILLPDVPSVSHIETVCKDKNSEYQLLVCVMLFDYKVLYGLFFFSFFFF